MCVYFEETDIRLKDEQKKNESNQHGGGITFFWWGVGKLKVTWECVAGWFYVFLTSVICIYGGLKNESNYRGGLHFWGD